MNREILEKIFPDLLKRTDKNRCPLCNKNIDKNSFKDYLSRKEFEISGMCQECQDKMFGQ